MKKNSIKERAKKTPQYIKDFVKHQDSCYEALFRLVMNDLVTDKEEVSITKRIGNMKPNKNFNNE